MSHLPTDATNRTNTNREFFARIFCCTSSGPHSDPEHPAAVTAVVPTGSADSGSDPHTYPPASGPSPPRPYPVPAASLSASATGVRSPIRTTAYVAGPSHTNPPGASSPYTRHAPSEISLAESHPELIPQCHPYPESAYLSKNFPAKFHSKGPSLITSVPYVTQGRKGSMCYGSFFSLSMMSNPTGTYLKKHEETLGNPYNYSSLQNLVNNKDLRFAAMVEEGNRHACLMVVMGKNMFLKSGTSTECVPFGAESVIYLRIDGQTHARPTFTGIAQYRSQTVPDQDWLETLRQTTHENLKAYVEYDRSFEVSNAFAVWGFINRLRDSHSDFSQGMTKALELPSSIVLQSSLDPSSRYLSSMEAR